MEHGNEKSGSGMSRWQGAAWVAMLVVGVALVLVILAPSQTQSPDALTVVAPAAENDGELNAVADVGPLVNDIEAVLEVGMMAPLDYTLKDMDGFDVSLESFKGKVILINFWATWCGPCKAEIPDLVELQTAYTNDLVVLGVSVDDTPEQMRPYAEQYQMNYPVLVANGRDDFKDAYGPLWGIPVSVIVDRLGRVHIRHAGIGTYEQFEQEILELL
jgi:thiol-disulfide isomerase/thioredoxin